MTERLYTTEEAATILKVKPALIRSWKHRERAMPAGYIPAPVPGGEAPLWTLGELRLLAETYHARPRRGRHPDESGNTS